MHNVFHFRTYFFENADNVVPDDLRLLAIIVGHSFYELAGLGVGGPLRGYVGNGGVGWNDGNV